ncbi:PLP-dependent aspartate aminotransferase family protein [bacterium]|nr:PLP-dependent aspartate aminotransferase family protein [bacterium]
MKSKNISDQAVHAGEKLDPATHSLTLPIYQTSVFGFESVDAMVAAFEGKTNEYIYSRIANPTVAAVEKKLAALEGSDNAVLFSSGLAASFALFSSMLQSGDHMIASSDLYGGTMTQLKEFVSKMGIQITFVNLMDSPELNLKQSIKPHTRLIFFETPTNPTLRVVDIESVVKFAQQHNLQTMMDNTFASPVNQQPLKMGVDIVYHSATKFLGGHDDVTAGVAMVPARLWKTVQRHRTYMGATLDPNTAWLLGRGVKTLDVRMQRHNQNALSLAKFLSQHPKVKRVFYPGLESSPFHTVAKKQMSGFGGMLSFEIDADRATLNRFLKNLKMVKMVPSLGGVETTILLPAFSSHFFMTADERKAIDVSDGLVRVNTGIEDSETIKEDFDQALNGLATN